VSGTKPSVIAYVGWPTQQQVDLMAPWLDRVYVHVYVDTAPQAYTYGAERFSFFAAANRSLGTKIDVWPIYSAEDTAWAAGSEFFMGEWLRDNGLTAAEAEFMSGWQAANWGTEIVVSGHQYYEYFFLTKYLQ
jgi:hypothetical protein